MKENIQVMDVDMINNYSYGTYLQQVAIMM